MWRTGAWVLALVVSALGWRPDVPPAAAAPAPTRILVLGDSQSQGFVGDWTWRYRLWQHLDGPTPGAVDLVGPSTGLWDGSAPSSSAYADPAFDRDHAAAWGRAAWQGADLVEAGLITDSRADVLVVALGLNDLVWGHTPESVVSSLRRTVMAARRDAPAIAVVLAEVPPSWMLVDGAPVVAELDDLLPALAAELSTSGSPVVVARTAHDYAEADTYDGVHPTASGEVLIAAAVADALAGLGIGSPYPRPLPLAPDVPRWPVSGLVATSLAGRVRLTWEPAPGASAQWIWQRDATTGGPWERLPLPAGGSSTEVGLLTAGHRYQFRLQSQRYRVTVADVVSATVEATPRAIRPGRVRALGARWVGTRRLRVSWRPVPGASSYAVRWRPVGRPGAARTRTTSRAGVTLRGLRPGGTYRVQARAGAGPWSSVRVR